MKKTILGISVFIFAIIFPFIMKLILEILPENMIKQVPEILIYLVMDVLLILILYFVYRKDLKKEWKLFKSNWKEYLENNLSYWIVGLVLMSFFNLLIPNIIGKDLPENEQLIRTLFKEMPLYMLFTTTIVAPFTEEIIYRKSLKDVFKNEKLYIIISGFLFGLAHIIYSYTGALDFLYIVPYGILGGSFALMYSKTKTIFVPMAFHFTHNFLSVLMTLLLTLL